MADPLDLQFEDEVVIKVGEIGPTLAVDCCLQEQHQRKMILSRLPIEEGADITDHSKIEPAKVVLDIIVSNFDPAFLAPPSVGFGARDLDAYGRLKQWQDERQRLNVETSLDFYENMLVTEVTAPRDVDSSTALIATVTFEEIITVSTERVSLASAKRAGTAAGKQVKQRGKQAAEQVTNASLLKQLSDLVGKLVGL